MVTLTHLLASAACLAASTLAAPNNRRTPHHQHHARGFDVSGVDWNAALKNKDWTGVSFGGKPAAPAAPAAAPAVAAPAPVAPVVAAPAAAAAAPAAAVVAVKTVTRFVAGKGTPAPSPAAAALVQAAGDNLVKAVVAPTLRTSTVAAPPAASPNTPSSDGLNMSPNGNEYAITVVNNCPHQIWQAGWQTNKAGALVDPRVLGNAMPAGSQITLAVPKAALGLQIWARTGCTGSGSSFTCAVGDCQGYQCSSIIWQKGPILAEFGSGLNTDMYNTDITAYDISAIPGNNVGCKIVPSIASCWTKYCPVSGCPLDQAWREDSDMHLGSPADTTCSNKSNFVVTFCPA